jgi:hypothetical protein
VHEEDANAISGDRKQNETVASTAKGDEELVAKVCISNV